MVAGKSPATYLSEGVQQLLSEECEDERKVLLDLDRKAEPDSSAKHLCSIPLIVLLELAAFLSGRQALRLEASRGISIAGYRAQPATRKPGIAPQSSTRPRIEGISQTTPRVSVDSGQELEGWDQL